MRTLAQALRGLDGAEVEVMCILPCSPKLDPLALDCERLGLAVQRMTLEGSQPLGQRQRWFRRLVSLLRDEGVDVFHQHRTGPYRGRWACLAARAARVPVVVATEHQAPDRRLRGWQRWLNWGADLLLDRLIVVSEDNRRQQIETGRRRPGLVETVHNGVDLAHLVPSSPKILSQKRAELGIPPQAPVVGTVGRLHRQKGIPTLLLAGARLRQRYPDLRLLLVGDGPMRDEVRRQIDELGLQDAVVLAGYRTDVADMLALMDVFCLASLWEPFGLVLVEAMALRRPVVATRVDGIPEVVADGETGLLVPPGRNEPLSEAIARCLDDPALAARLGGAGCRRAHAMFTARAMAERTYRIYQQAAERRGGRWST